MEEVWKQIPGFETYLASNTGLIKRRNRILKFTTDDSGYYRVTLCKHGTGKNCSVSRLVAATFVENPEQKLTVDHINRCRTDNRALNLRWATHQEQMLNRDYPIGKSNLRHITPVGKGYKFQIRRNTLLYQKYFSTLEEAVSARDEYLNPSSSCSGSQESVTVVSAPPHALS